MLGGRSASSCRKIGNSLPNVWKACERRTYGSLTDVEIRNAGSDEKGAGVDTVRSVLSSECLLVALVLLHAAFKRTLAANGVGFPPSVFETRPFFAQ